MRQINLLAINAVTNHEGPVLFIPRSEAYYWTPEWQQCEREAEREIREGKTRIFSNPEEAGRWLMDGEDS